MTSGFISDGSSLSFEVAFNAYNASLKFRPNETNADTYQTRAASRHPITRLEEMYFIWAEAEVLQFSKSKKCK